MFGVEIDSEVVLFLDQDKAQEVAKEHRTTMDQVEVWLEDEGFIATEDDPTIICEAPEFL